MPPQGIDTTAIQEAFRRRAGQTPSTAALPTGAANLSPESQTPQQVLAQRQLPSQTPTAPQNASDTGIQQLNRSAPGEAEIIVKALISRLRNLGGVGG